MDYHDTKENDIESIRKDFPVTKKKDLYELWLICSDAIIYNKINH